MPDRIAIKQLRDSDLTFFESHFRQRSNIRQKAINLNADVFTGEFYPDLAAGGVGAEILVALTIFGPGTLGPLPIARKVTKSRGKNWRLNGEFVKDPDDEPGRFDPLKPDDVAVLEFTGDTKPSAITLVLVSAALDPALCANLASVIPGGRQTMVAVPRGALGPMVDAAGTPAHHPIRVLLEDPELEAELEEASFGSAPAVAKLRQRAGPKVTAEALAKAKAAAEAIGADGEALAWIHLSAQKDAGVFKDAVWTSDTDATAPWDFEVTLPDGVTVRIEAKSTAGPFTNTIHLSAAELATAAEGGVRYDIWRLFELDEDGGKLRAAEDICGFAKSVIDGLALPAGVEPDGFSIDPASIPGWQSTQVIEPPDEPE